LKILSVIKGHVEAGDIAATEEQYRQVGRMQCEALLHGPVLSVQLMWLDPFGYEKAGGDT
jgi:hypothetical protein